MAKNVYQREKPIDEKEKQKHNKNGYNFHAACFPFRSYAIPAFGIAKSADYCPSFFTALEIVG